jgi:hypothetical protein
LLVDHRWFGLRIGHPRHQQRHRPTAMSILFIMTSMECGRTVPWHWVTHHLITG